MRRAGIRKVLLFSSFALLGVPTVAKAGADGDGPLSPIVVRTCDVYGKGFFRVPGTDGICIKAGGYVRADLAFGAWPNDRAFVGGQLDLNNQPLHTDETGIATFMTRASGFVDARLSTSYGTARAFLNGYVDAAGGQHIGATTDSYADAVINRAFLQFSGFTVGERQSNFDLLKRGFSYTPGWARDPDSSSGTLLGAYTAHFGNGFSATFSLEDNSFRRNAVWAAGDTSLGIGEFPGPSTFGHNIPGTCIPSYLSATSSEERCSIGAYESNSMPDIVGSLLYDQNWGTAQIAGALHQIRAGFGGQDFDSWGSAIGADVDFKLPVTGPKDTLWFHVGFAQGSSSYAGLGQFGGTGIFDRFDGTNVAAGWALDGIFNNTPGAPFGGSVVLPQAWDVKAAVEHYWTPALRTSLFGGYSLWSPTDAGNSLMCSSPFGPVRTIAGAFPNGITPLPGCDFGFGVGTIGSRTIWNPIKHLDVGLEVMYTQINTNFDPNRIRLSFGGGFGSTAGLYTPADEGVWSSLFRVQYSFYP